MSACATLASNPSGGSPPGASGPSPTATVGTRYAFQPSLSGSGARSFSIQNRPPWASFSASSGLLSGTPGPAHVGAHRNVRILAQIGAARLALPAFTITVRAAAGAIPRDSVTLSWRPPAQNIDGSALTNLAGYRIYSGSTRSTLEPRATLANAGLTRYVVESLRADERYFAITALTIRNVESALSEIVRMPSD